MINEKNNAKSEDPQKYKKLELEVQKMLRHKANKSIWIRCVVSWNVKVLVGMRSSKICHKEITT